MDKLYAVIPRDRILHFALMVVIAILNVLLFWLEARVAPAFVAAHPLAVFIVNLALTVGCVKEAGDWLDNKALRLLGREPMHGVEAWDIVATTLGGVFVSALLLWAGRA